MQEKNTVFNHHRKDTADTGSDILGGGGTISDEDMHAIDGGKSHKGGPDHSLENYEDHKPTSGDGPVQDKWERARAVPRARGAGGRAEGGCRKTGAGR